MGVNTTGFRLGLAACVSLLALRAWADEPDKTKTASAPDEAGAAAATAVGEVVVTANRTPADVGTVGVAFTVISQDQIRLDQGTTVADLIARTPGVVLTRAGGAGQLTSVFLRGGDSAQTLVLIDGVKVNDPSDPAASYDFSNLNTGDVSRIEVLRGPQSTLYGSEAIGGVVNVITADATAPFEGSVQAEGGSYGTALARLALGGKADRLNWRVGAYYQSSDSVSAFDKTFGGTGSAPFHTAGISGRARYSVSDALSLDERLYFTWSRNEFDGFDTPACVPVFTSACSFGNDNEFGRSQQFIDYTGLNLSLFDGRLKNRVAFEYQSLSHHYEDPNQAGTKFTFLSLGAATTAEYEGVFAIAPGYQAVFGAQSERATISANAPLFPPAVTGSLVTDSGYAQITGEVLPGLTLTGGGRYDDTSSYGGHFTGQASAAWRLNGGSTILRASFGQGFKSPTLYQLDSPYGNRALRPEEADGWDAGIEQHLFGGRVSVQASYFGRSTRNLIEFISCFGVTSGVCAGNTSGGIYENVARAYAQGAEVEASWQVAKGLELSGNYTYTEAVDRSPGSPTYNLQLPTRPRNTANLLASYQWPNRLRTAVAARYADRSFNDAAHTIPLQSYILWDLRASYPLTRSLEIYGRIENLTDKHYEVEYQYGTLGRAAYAGLRYVF